MGEDRRLGGACVRQASLPVLIALAALLSVGPVGLALSIRGSRPAPPSVPATLGDIARAAGCALTEFDADPRSNPPVSGRVDERVAADDGSYVGRRPPPPAGAMHAMFHGRVLVQYAPSLPAEELRALDRAVGADPAKVLLFANRTGMPAPVAATAYLTLMTCPRVDAGTLAAVRAFRARRADFGQRF
jgi:hypothetical protein